MFRFVKQPKRANHPTRRYRLVRGEAAGALEVGGDAPDGDSVTLALTCDAALSEAEREVALGTARRFLDELAAGLRLQVAEVPGTAGWSQDPLGGAGVRLDFHVMCGNP